MIPRVTPGQLTAKKTLSIAEGLFPDQDSNLEKRHQKPVCYHYTIGEYQQPGGCEASAKIKRISRKFRNRTPSIILGA